MSRVFVGRRLFHVCCLLSLQATFLHSQQRLIVPQMTVGLHGGVIVSTVLFNPEVISTKHLYEKFVIGGCGGFVFRYIGNRVCGFQVELNYLQRGWREYGNDSIEHVNYKRHLHYIELPFLTHIYLGNSQYNFIFNLGPQVGFCFKEKSYGVRQTVLTTQYDKITHRVDWGVVGGMGFLYKTPKENTFEFEIRFSYSFGYLYTNSVTSFFSASNPITLSANIGWMWHVKNKKRNRQRFNF